MNAKTTTSSTDMRIDDMNDLAKEAQTRTISREELKGWDPDHVLFVVNFVTGATSQIGPYVHTIEEALELLESGELLRLAKEREKIEEEMLNSLCEW